MNWSNYLYLVGIALAALGLLGLATRSVPRLVEAHDTHKRPASELLLLGAVMVLGALTIYWNCLFGGSLFGYTDVGSDTLQQYVPYYLDLIRSLGNGTLGPWDSTYGLGASFMAYWTWIADPFNLVTVPLTLLLGTAQLGRVLALVQALKIVLSGYLFDHLLTYYCRAPLSRILGGSLFAFGGWLILWGQHYWLGAVYVAAVLMVLLVELLMERWTAPRFVGLALASLGSIMMGVYSGFMVLLFAAIYAIIRAVHVSQCRSLGEFMRFFGRLALPVVCGILMSCVLIVPYANLILNETSRVTNAGGMTTSQRIVGRLTGFVPLQWVPLIASRLLGNGLVYTGDVFNRYVESSPDSLSYLLNSYEFLMVGAGGAVLMLGSQCLAAVFSKGSRRDRALVAITLALVILFCVNEFLPALFSALDLKYRASFALVFPLCIASAVGWEEVVTKHTLHKPALLISAGITFVIIVWSLATTVDGRLVSLFYLLATVVFLAGFWCLGRDKGTRAKGATPLLVAVCCAAAIATSVIDGFFVTNSRGIATVGSFPASTDTDADTQAALAYLRSTDDGFYRVGKTYADWTTVDDSLIQGYSTVSAYNSVTDADVVEFYKKEWPELLGAGGATQDYALDPFEAAPSRLLGIRYVLSKEALGVPWLDLVQQFGSVYLYEDVREPSIASSSFIYEGESEANATSLEDRRSLLGGTVVVPDDVASSLQLSPFDPSAMGTEGPGEFRLTSGSSVEGTMDVLADSVVCLSIPHTSGWSVYVDGKKVDTFRADYGFIGFVLPAGSHHIEARYVPVGLKAGVTLSIAGLALCVTSCILIWKRQSR